MTDLFAVSQYYGGGSDGFYGNYGGTGTGPTSYNPWSSGPGGSSYVGGTSNPVFGSIGDQYNGRVAPSFVMQVVSKDNSNLHLIATGTAAQLLARADSIIATAASDNKSFVDTYRAPNLRMPNVASIDFASSSAFLNYLNRSAVPLIPDATLAAAEQSVLGRPASADEIRNMQVAVDQGASLSNVRWNAAHSQEAADRVGDIYRSVLGRDPDAPGLKSAQDALGNTMSLPDLRTSAAKSQEAAADLNNIYTQVLGRSIDGTALINRENALANGWAMREERWDVAHSGEAGDAIGKLYQQVLGRGLNAADPADASALARYKDWLGGASTLGDVRSNLAHSGEAATALNNFYTQILDRGIDSVALNNRENTMAAGWALRDQRWDIAHSDEAWGKVDYIYQQTGVRPWRWTVQAI